MIIIIILYFFLSPPKRPQEKENSCRVLRLVVKANKISWIKPYDLGPALGAVVLFFGLELLLGVGVARRLELVALELLSLLHGLDPFAHVLGKI